MPSPHRKRRPPSRHGRRGTNSSGGMMRQALKHRDPRQFATGPAGSIMSSLNNVDGHLDEFAPTDGNDFRYDEGRALAPPKQHATTTTLSERNRSGKSAFASRNQKASSGYQKFPPPGNGLPERPKRPRTENNNNHKPLADVRERQREDRAVMTALRAPAVKPQVKRKVPPRPMGESLFRTLLNDDKAEPAQDGVAELVTQDQQQSMGSMEDPIPRKKSRKNPPGQSSEATIEGEDDGEEEKPMQSRPFPKYRNKGRKQPPKPQPENVQIGGDDDASSHDEETKIRDNGQKARDIVAGVEQESTPGTWGTRAAKFANKVKTAASAAVSSLSSSFLPGTPASTPKKKTSLEANKRQRRSSGRWKRKASRIVPGASLATPTRRERKNPGENSHLPQRSSDRVAKKAKKAPAAIDLCGSDDDNESEVVLPDADLTDPIAVNRIAFGRLVSNEGCSVQLTRGGVLEMNFRPPRVSGRTTRNSSGTNGHTRHLALDLSGDILQLWYYRVRQGVDDNPGSFLALTTTRAFVERVQQFAPSYDPESDDSIERFILIEFSEAQRLDTLIDAMKCLPDLHPFFTEHAGIVRWDDARVYCRALLEDTPKEKKKKEESTRDFLAGRRDEDVVLVYPFAGDKIEMEKAAEGLREFNHFDSSSFPASAHPTALGKEEDSSATRTHCLTITVSDCNRLAPEEYLNDTLIDFFMKWMTRNDSPDTSMCHYFSTHFFSKLLMEGPGGVQKWTERKGIDIFEKRLIFVPVNKSLHWSLAVIVNPGYIIPHCDRVDRAPDGKLEDIHIEQFHDKPRPVILFFDSLKCHPKATVAGQLRRWLNAEWKRKKGESNRDSPLFTKTTMEVISPGAPKQYNGYDCGVFTCRNAFAITTMKDCVFSYGEIHAHKGFLKEAFDYNHEDIERIRDEMLTLIERLSKLYEAWNIEQKRRKQAAKAAKLKSDTNVNEPGQDGNTMDRSVALKTPSKPTRDSQSLMSSQSPGQIVVWSDTNVDGGSAPETPQHSTQDPESHLASQSPVHVEVLDGKVGNERNTEKNASVDDKTRRLQSSDQDKPFVESESSSSEDERGENGKFRGLNVDEVRNGDCSISDLKGSSSDKGGSMGAVVTYLEKKHGKAAPSPVDAVLGLKRVKNERGSSSNRQNVASFQAPSRSKTKKSRNGPPIDSLQNLSCYGTFDNDEGTQEVGTSFATQHLTEKESRQNDGDSAAGAAEPIDVDQADPLGLTIVGVDHRIPRPARGDASPHDAAVLAFRNSKCDDQADTSDVTPRSTATLLNDLVCEHTAKPISEASAPTRTKASSEGMAKVVDAAEDDPMEIDDEKDRKNPPTTNQEVINVDADEFPSPTKPCTRSSSSASSKVFDVEVVEPHTSTTNVVDSDDDVNRKMSMMDLQSKTDDISENDSSDRHDLQETTEDLGNEGNANDELSDLAEQNESNHLQKTEDERSVDFVEVSSERQTSPGDVDRSPNGGKARDEVICIDCEDNEKPPSSASIATSTSAEVQTLNPSTRRSSRRKEAGSRLRSSTAGDADECASLETESKKENKGRAEAATDNDTMGVVYI